MAPGYGGVYGSSYLPFHFDAGLMTKLEQAGVRFASVTLHVGIATFRPLRTEDLSRDHLHEESFEVPEATLTAITTAQAAGKRVIAVGTTTVRALESAARHGVLRSGSGRTDLFIRPPYEMRVIDGLITNFHLPRSSLLMLVASLVGRQRLLDAYARAVQQDYRFYSYGDAMLLL